MKIDISEEHKFNLKCLAIAIICFAIDFLDGGIMNDPHISGIALWIVIGICFGFILQNYREHKK